MYIKQDLEKLRLLWIRWSIFIQKFNLNNLYLYSVNTRWGKTGGLKTPEFLKNLNDNFILLNMEL